MIKGFLKFLFVATMLGLVYLIMFLVVGVHQP